MALRIVTALAVLGVLGGAVVGAAWVFQRSLIYLPSGDVPPVAAVLPGGEEVVFATEDGVELAGWYLPADGEEVAAAVVFNGNAGNRAGRAPLARRLAERGITTLLFDYRGYGGNPGHPTEARLVRDGTAAATYLAGRTAAPAVYLGESLGAAVATAVAVERPPAALVLRSPFTSLADAGKANFPFLPVGWLLADRYPVVDQIGDVAVPLLVVASTDDDVVPFRQSEAVHAAARGEKRMVIYEGLGHNDPELNSGASLADEVASFVREVVGPAG